MTRTFIALEMSPNGQQHLAEVIRQVSQSLPSVHWVNPAGIHLTLSFLGELTDEQVEEAIRAAEYAAGQIRPFAYCHTRLGIFGSPRQPRVIWMGIEETTGALIRLHRILNETLEQRGFAIDKRPFSPHLTLARLKAPLPQSEQTCLQKLLAGKQEDIISRQHYPVRSIEVLKSELLRTGARYSILQECPLIS